MFIYIALPDVVSHIKLRTWMLNEIFNGKGITKFSRTKVTEQDYIEVQRVHN
jgi:hypothetical protein